MAISKSTILKAKKPEPLYEIPELDYANDCNCPCHPDKDPVHKHIELYDSYDEAVIACGQIFLKPGETHTEFYKDNNVYHCVIAIGNINPNKGHLYLEDFSNGEQSLNNILNVINTSTAKNTTSIANNLVKIKALLSELDAQDISINSLIESLELTTDDLSTLSSNFNNLSTNFNNLKSAVDGYVKRIETLEIDDVSLRTDIDDISIRLNNVSTRLSAEIEDVSLRVKNTYSEIDSKIDEKTSEMKDLLTSYVDTTITEKITDVSSVFNNKINNISTNLSNTLNNVSNNLSKTINEVSTNLFAAINNVSSDINSKFETLEDNITGRVNNLSEDVFNILNKTEDIDNKTDDVSKLLRININDVAGKIQTLNTSVDEISENLSKYIKDASIDSFFNKDIYTLNLCCYTPAGWVTIKDDYDDTSNGNYRTYVKGDEVELTAHRNIGYKFIKWVQYSTNSSTDSSIKDLTFKDSDLDVIAISDNDLTDKIMESAKWVALYSPYNKVNLYIELTNKDVAELTGDNVIISGLTEDPSYFDDYTSLTFLAAPISQHEFKYYIIDNVKYSDKIKPITTDTNDVNVTAYFEEIRYHVHGEADPINGGDVETNKPSTVLVGSSVTLTANAADGYEFTEWHKSLDGGQTYEEDVYSVESSLTFENVDSSLWFKANFTLKS